MSNQVPATRANGSGLAQTFLKRFLTRTRSLESAIHSYGRCTVRNLYPGFSVILIDRPQASTLDPSHSRGQVGIFQLVCLLFLPHR